MRKIYILFTVCFALTSCDKNPLSILFQPKIKICDLYENQTKFANSLVQLHNLTVIKCSGILSISYAEVTDGSCSIILFSTKPYTKNETIDIKARFKVMFNFNGQTISALVTDDFPVQLNKILSF